MYRKILQKLVFVLALALASVLLFGTLACETAPKDITFKNELSVPINIYFSRADDDEWSDSPTAVHVRSGSSVGIGFSQIDSESGKRFDIGAIDGASMNYDVHDTVLYTGDLVVLSGDTQSAVYTITRADGTVTELNAYIHPKD